MVKNAAYDSDSDDDLWKGHDSWEKRKTNKKKVVKRKVKKKGKKNGKKKGKKKGNKKRVGGRKVNGVYLSDKLLKLLAEIVCTCKK